MSKTTQSIDVTSQDPGAERTDIVVRRLRPSDLEAVIALDAKNTGRRREEYFKLKLRQALTESGVEVSLAADVDGVLTGFLLCWVYYGEFGQPEPVAVLDTLGVHPSFRGRGIGSAMLRQLSTNLLGLNIQHLRTEVAWDAQELLAFFHTQGFRPAARLCLDLELEYEPG